MNAVVTADRDTMTEEEKQLFLCDLKEVCAEYFECGEKYTVDIAKAKEGFCVCVIFDAARVKKFKKPR